MEMMKSMDFNQDKVNAQFQELGLKPEDVISKVRGPALLIAAGLLASRHDDACPGGYLPWMMPWMMLALEA
eukprot:1149883-Pelagomonas_calceolata.AAC.3